VAASLMTVQPQNREGNERGTPRREGCVNQEVRTEEFTYTDLRVGGQGKLSYSVPSL
jgi:hypothetical protein